MRKAIFLIFFLGAIIFASLSYIYRTNDGKSRSPESAVKSAEDIRFDDKSTKLILSGICEAVRRYNALENSRCVTLDQLEGKYMMSTYKMVDSWKNKFEIDPSRGIVFSKGPNGVAGDSDDIELKYK